MSLSRALIKLHCTQGYPYKLLKHNTPTEFELFLQFYHIIDINSIKICKYQDIDNIIDISYICILYIFIYMSYMFYIFDQTSY